MSRNVLEKLLHQLCVDRMTKQKFKEDAEKVLARYDLSEEETNMVLTFDVAGMQKHGVNPMLTMGYWQENAPSRSISAYTQALRPHDSSAPVFSAALKK